MEEMQIINTKCPVLNSEKDSNTSEILLKIDQEQKPKQIICPYFDKGECELSEKACNYNSWKQM